MLPWYHLNSRHCAAHLTPGNGGETDAPTQSDYFQRTGSKATFFPAACKGLHRPPFL